MKRKALIQNCVLIALFAAIISVSAFISIPIFMLSITMQTFSIFLSLFLLGGKLGTASVFLYVVLGAIGIPVFSGFSGGVGRLLDPLGGFIVGFVLLSLVYWFFTFIRVSRVISSIIAHAVLYIFGVLWYVLIYDGDFIYAVCTLVLPFIIFDALKLWLAFFVSKRIKI